MRLFSEASEFKSQIQLKGFAMNLFRDWYSGHFCPLLFLRRLNTRVPPLTFLHWCFHLGVESTENPEGQFCFAIFRSRPWWGSVQSRCRSTGRAAGPRLFSGITATGEKEFKSQRVSDVDWGGGRRAVKLCVCQILLDCKGEVFSHKCAQVLQSESLLMKQTFLAYLKLLRNVIFP